MEGWHGGARATESRASPPHLESGQLPEGVSASGKWAEGQATCRAGSRHSLSPAPLSHGPPSGGQPAARGPQLGGELRTVPQSRKSLFALGQDGAVEAELARCPGRPAAGAHVVPVCGALAETVSVCSR